LKAIHNPKEGMVFADKAVFNISKIQIESNSQHAFKQLATFYQYSPATALPSLFGAVFFRVQVNSPLLPFIGKPISPCLGTEPAAKKVNRCLPQLGHQISLVSLLVPRYLCEAVSPSFMCKCRFHSVLLDKCLFLLYICSVKTIRLSERASK